MNETNSFSFSFSPSSITISSNAVEIAGLGDPGNLEYGTEDLEYGEETLEYGEV